MKTLIIAPHPDDEVLGVGGTLFRRKKEGVKIAWVIMTSISKDSGWSEREINDREAQINQISELYKFDKVYQLNFIPRELEKIPIHEIIEKISKVFLDFKPEEVFLPHRSDIHSDHRVTFDAAISCTKWFRFPSIRRILSYETLSETEFGLLPESNFHPNYFIDISEHLEDKIKAMKIYASEIQDFPFPRSIETLTSLAKFRGSTAGYKAAESFVLLRERQ